jgi:hypothetical protein
VSDEHADWFPEQVPPVCVQPTQYVDEVPQYVLGQLEQLW